MWQTDDVIEQGTIEEVLSELLFVLANHSFTNTHVIQFRSKVHAILQKVEIWPASKLEIIGRNETRFSVFSCRRKHEIEDKLSFK